MIEGVPIPGTKACVDCTPKRSTLQLNSRLGASQGKVVACAAGESQTFFLSDEGEARALRLFFVQSALGPRCVVASCADCQLAEWTRGQLWSWLGEARSWIGSVQLEHDVISDPSLLSGPNFQLVLRGRRMSMESSGCIVVASSQRPLSGWHGRWHYSLEPAERLSTRS